MADVVVIGGGAVGLWTALTLARRGARVTLLEASAEPLGTAASATPVGALVPFPLAEPDDPLAAYQARALMGLPAAVAALEEEAGGCAGYANRGRVLLLADAEARARAERQVASGRERMPLRPGDGPEGRAAAWALAAGLPDTLSAVVARDAAAAGVLVERASAQIDPPALGRLLWRALERRAEAGGVTLRLGAAVQAIGPRPGGGALVSLAGERLEADHAVITAGWRSDGLTAPLSVPDGRPIKGQAALLEGILPEDCPVIQAPRLFVVAHGPGRVAVGATREAGRTDCATDDGLDAVIARAAEAVPVLAGARVRRRWAGIRPAPPGRMPRIGPVPGAPGLWLATGGHGIGLALAASTAADLADAIEGRPSGLPPAFAP